MRIDRRFYAGVLAAVLALMPVARVGSDPASEPAGRASGTSASPATGAAGSSEEAPAAAEKPAEPFIPSERISADSAISFPVDI